jgi:thiol-disulfide isomerase/thioredoxin
MTKILRSLVIGCLAAFLLTGRGSAQPVDFTLPDLAGKEHRLADYRGKWVLVNYWATWCPPCREELPELEVFHASHSDRDAVVLGVNMDEIGLDELRSFVDEQFLSFPILRLGPSSGTELGAIPGLPTSFLISPSGEVAAKHVGALTKKALETFIERHAANHLKGQP